MSDFPPTTIRIQVDPTNPGQFFACCGLLELAYRIDQNATAAFAEENGLILFELHLPYPDGFEGLIKDLSKCNIASTMSENQLKRLKQLLNKNKKTFTRQEVEEKQSLKDLWDRERLCFGHPFNIWLDWWNDDFAGGSSFKTWAGKQFAIDISRGMQNGLSASCNEVALTDILYSSVNDGSLPFYFDSDIGGHSSSLDVGYSLDAVKIRAQTRPAIELLSFIGLQRFRPKFNREDNLFTYTIWCDHFPPLLASATVSGGIDSNPSLSFAFQLLDRTKYLKAFLSAKPLPTKS